MAIDKQSLLGDRKVIYDFGANNGDDIPYYLLKADLVVAVEANPALCGLISERFGTEIENGRLVVENVVITAEKNQCLVPFYLHKSNHVLSQFPTPEFPGMFDQVQLDSKSVSDIVSEHGKPHYVKIDLEHYDATVLRSLFDSGHRPPYVSAEAHSSEIFSVMTALGGYQSFKLVDGSSVPDLYGSSLVNTKDGIRTYSFPSHSAGPFGDDLNGDWMSPDRLFRILGFEGFGWKDIHASLNDPANEALDFSRTRDFLIWGVFRHLRSSVTRLLSRFRRLLKRVGG